MSRRDDIITLRLPPLARQIKAVVQGDSAAQS